MLRRHFLVGSSLALFGAALRPLPAFAQVGGQVDAKTVLDRIDDLYRADHSHSVMEMKVVTKRYQRTLKMEGWTKGEDHALFRILSPKKEYLVVKVTRSE